MITHPSTHDRRNPTRNGFHQPLRLTATMRATYAPRIPTRATRRCCFDKFRSFPTPGGRGRVWKRIRARFCNVFSTCTCVYTYIYILYMYTRGYICASMRMHMYTNTTHAMRSTCTAMHTHACIRARDVSQRNIPDCKSCCC